MKLLIAGSRSITDVSFVLRCYLNSKLDSDVTEIVSGGARGVDTAAEAIAKQFEKEFKCFRAEWKKYGKKAGVIRNKMMVDYCTAAIIVWDGISPGTKSTIDLLTSSKKQFLLYKNEGS